MDKGRTLVKSKTKNGEWVVRALGKSWKVVNGKLMENTTKPCYVRQEGKDELQYLRPWEAERLMGMVENITGIVMRDKPSVRLRCIGNAWDMNTVKALLKWWVEPTDNDSPRMLKRKTVR